MAELLVLSEADVARLLDLDELLGALREALMSTSAGRASVPPRVAASTEAGLLGAMAVNLPGVALATKLVSVFPANHKRGRPSHQALIAMFDAEEGTPSLWPPGTRRQGRSTPSRRRWQGPTWCAAAPTPASRS